jgi:D-amino-acid oxidase
MTSHDAQHIVILGAGVIGLTTSLVLSHTYPSAKITVIAKHFPGDRSIDYASPWAGANWSSMAHDNGPLEKYDEVTFRRFGELIDGHTVHGCRALRAGEGNDVGLGRMGMWAIFDAPISETGILTEATGKVWYDALVGGLRELSEGEMASRGGKKEGGFGVEFPSTYRINTQVYLQWYVLHSNPFLSPILTKKKQATSTSPIQRRHAHPPPLPLCEASANRPPFHHSASKLHRTRLPRTLRYPRHESASYARPDDACC